MPPLRRAEASFTRTAKAALSSKGEGEEASTSMGGTWGGAPSPAQSAAGEVPARRPLLPLLRLLLLLLLLLLLDAVVVDVELKLPVQGVENRERDRRRSAADPAPGLLLAAAWDTSNKPPPERPLLSSSA